MKKLFPLFIAILFIGKSQSQNIGIGTTTGDPSAKLDITSTTSGLLIPRMTSTQRDAIVSPAKGLIVFVNTDSSFYYYGGSGWIKALSEPEAWNLKGNANATGKFIGTLDTSAVRIRTRNIERVTIDSTGFVGINNTTPKTGLHIVDNGSLNTDITIEYNTVENFYAGGLIFNKSKGAYDAKLPVDSNNTLGMILFNGYDGMGYTLGSAIFSRTQGDFSIPGKRKGNLEFRTNNGGGATERMRINSEGNVGIGTTSPNSTALLDMTSTSKGLLIPRMTHIQRDAIVSPAKGLKVFVNTDSSFYYYNGTAWVQQLSAQTGWSLTGNAGTNPATHFIGTTDNKPLKFRVNNVNAGIIDSDLGNTGLGFRALDSIKTGLYNVAMGHHALSLLKTGLSNTAIGYNALRSDSTSNNNTAIGFAALVFHKSGSNNTAVGTVALLSDSSGIRNTAIGFGADVTSNNLTNATALGANAKVGASNSLVLGDNAMVGIGTSIPLMKLHVAKTDSAVALFENTQALNTNVSNALYFKTGSGGFPYTGAIKTIGQATNAARLGLFTFADPSPNGLLERLSITDDGNVGIGTTAPGTKLEVAGQVKITGGSPGTGKVLTSDASGLASWAPGSTHAIGDNYGGGIVFYVYDNGQHGLIAATADQNGGVGIRWYGGTNTNTRARADGVGAGLKNTAIIIANQGPVDGNAFAATVCNEYSVTVVGVTYGDWYLPSKHELNLLYLQKTVVGGFASDFYWSSSETDNGSAWVQDFSIGDQFNYGKNNALRVRAVRAF